MICQSTSSFNLSNAEVITGELSALWMICESPDPMLSLGPNVCDLDVVQEFRFLGAEGPGAGIWRHLISCIRLFNILDALSICRCQRCLLTNVIDSFRERV